MAGKIATLGIALTAVIGVGTLAAVDLSQSRKHVTIDVAGVVRPFSTWSDDAGSVLSEAGVELHDGDQLEVGKVVPERPDKAKVVDGDVLKISRAREIRAHRNGSVITKRTTAQTLAEALVDLEADYVTRAQVAGLDLDLTDGDTIEVIDHTHEGTEEYTLPAFLPLIEQELSPLDEAKFVASSATPGQLALEVTRVSKQSEARSEELSFPTTTRSSDELFEGEMRVVQIGKPGLNQTKEYVVMRAGKEVQRHVLESQSSEPVEHLVEEGTKAVTPLALIEAGLDPQAPLVETTDEEGRRSIRFVAPVGSITSEAEIARIKGEVEEVVLGPYTGDDPRGIAQSMLDERGWGNEFSCLVSLWDRESGWNPHAHNASSGAYGIPQALPGSKMASAGADWQTNPRTQISWGLGYIAGRYETPCGAWSFFQANNWY